MSTRDYGKLIKRGIVADPKAQRRADLGITPTRVEDVVPTYIGRKVRQDDIEAAY